MHLEVPAVLSEMTESGETVDIREESHAWRELQLAAKEEFAATLRVAYHPAETACNCPPRLVAIHHPRYGHFAILSVIPVTPESAADLTSRYSTFITPLLWRLELQSIRRPEGER
jgi:hypothetical protein